MKASDDVRRQQEGSQEVYSSITGLSLRGLGVQVVFLWGLLLLYLWP